MVRKLLVLITVLALGGVLVSGGRWVISSLEYVSTDDADVKAAILTISSDVAGIIQGLTKEEGEHVVRGKILAMLDSRDIAIEIRQVEAELERARKSWTQARAELQLALEKRREETNQAKAALNASLFGLEDSQVELHKLQKDWQRAQQLSTRELIPRQELDHAEFEVLRARARVSLLEQNVKEKEAAIRLAQIQKKEIAIREAEIAMRKAYVREVTERLSGLKHDLDLRTIRSPVTGVIAKKVKQQGEHLQAGQPIYMLIDTSQFWIEANIEETKIGFIKPGSRAIGSRRLASAACGDPWSRVGPGIRVVQTVPGRQWMAACRQLGRSQRPWETVPNG
jgi:membrane fusion protein, multidrug efflux system